MDNLDKLFNENRDRFDEEPGDGHFQRFESKLEKLHPKSTKKLPISIFMKIASVLVVVLLSANLLVQLLPQKPGLSPLVQANREMNETASFYTTRINSGLSQLRQMADQGIGSEQEFLQIKKELDEMDVLHQELQKEYSNNPDDERVINAMIDYYQTKLNIINTIKNDLQNVKTIKNKQHENTSL